MARLDVVTFGEILWDLFGDDPRTRRGASRPAMPRRYRRELGGAPSNVAVGLARLGVRSAVAGGVGADPFGDALVAELAAEGVDTRFVMRFPNRTGLTFVTRDAKGEPSFLFYRHGSADMAVTAADIDAAVGRASFVLLGTSTLVSEELAGATTRVLEVARAAGAAIVVDLNVRAHLWPSPSVMRRAVARLAAEADVVKASAGDLAALGARASGELAWLLDACPGAAHVVTRGAGPASVHLEGREIACEPAWRARCVDATGAGDAFLAGVLATLSAARAVPGKRAFRASSTWVEALALGHEMGAKAIARPGAVAGLVGLAPLVARLARLRKGKAAR